MSDHTSSHSGERSGRRSSKLPRIAILLLSALATAGLMAHARSEILSVLVDGTTRTALVYVPDGAVGADRLPLVLVFHGSALNGRTMEQITGFSELAEQEQFIAVYPNGSGPTNVLSWNAGSCCSFAMDRNVDDLGFVDALLDELLAQYPADSDRVYATGFSNGGMLTYKLAIEFPERFAAIAVVSGAMFASQEPSSVPMPALIIHGTDDAVIPYLGGWGELRTLSGKTEPALAVAEAVAFWIASNGCDDASETTTERNAQTATHSGCTDEAEVVAVSLLGGRHVWPVVSANENAFLLSDDALDVYLTLDDDIPWDLFETGLDATGTIWQFFERHSR